MRYLFLLFLFPTLLSGQNLKLVTERGDTTIYNFHEIQFVRKLGTGSILFFGPQDRVRESQDTILAWSLNRFLKVPVRENGQLSTILINPLKILRVAPLTSNPLNSTTIRFEGGAMEIPINIQYFNAMLDTAIVYIINNGGGGDNWGSQVVQHDTTLIGDGTGGNPLGINPDLIDDWNRNIYNTSDTIETNRTVWLEGKTLSFIGADTFDSKIPFTIQIDGNEPQIQRWKANSETVTLYRSDVEFNLASTAPFYIVGNSNVGALAQERLILSAVDSVTVEGYLDVDSLPYLTGANNVGTQLRLQGNVNGQVLTWSDGAWIFTNPTSGADNWGTQVVVHDTTLNGNGTIANPLSVDTSIIATNWYVDTHIGPSINIYNTSDTIEDDRIVNLGNNDLTFKTLGGTVVEQFHQDLVVDTNSYTLLKDPTENYEVWLYGNGSSLWSGLLTTINGEFRLQSYATGTGFTGTPEYFLGVTAAGNVIVTGDPTAGLSIENIYNTSDTLTNDRELWMLNNDLTFYTISNEGFNFKGLYFKNNGWDDFPQTSYTELNSPLEQYKLKLEDSGDAIFSSAVFDGVLYIQTETNIGLNKYLITDKLVGGTPGSSPIVFVTSAAGSTGSGVVATDESSDLAGRFTLFASGTGITTGKIADVNFTYLFDVEPTVHLQPENDTAAALNDYLYVKCFLDRFEVWLSSGASAWTSGAAVELNYQVIGGKR